MFKHFAIVSLFFLQAGFAGFGQEQLRPLGQNPAKVFHEKQKQNKSNPPDVPLALPFFDDFSGQGPFPDYRLWSDSMVYINQHYPVNSLTIGTATFDAMNKHGEIYPEATVNAYQFEADRLSSHPIRLDSVFEPVPMKLGPESDVVLSFYYQPQGLGAPPRERDSLVVEFLHTPGYFTEDPENPEEEIWVDDLWESIWSTQGKSLEVFLEENNQTYFQRVSIKIENEIYFKKDFMFRFKNYGSFPLEKTPLNMAGNNSVWHIDYVTLDYGRDLNNPYYYDIAFSSPAQSIMREYTAIPWRQYIADPQSLLRNRFDIKIANLDEIVHNYTYRYFIQDEQGNNIKNYSGGTWNIAPFLLQGYQNYEAHSNPMLIPAPLPLTPAESREFKVYHVVREGNQGDERPRNDTMVYHQVFSNFMAYDNGTAHAGYGVIGYSPRGAVRYILNTQDTLSAVRFYFNPTLNEQNNINFHVKIWKSLDPEVLLYESDLVSTEFPTGLNRFANYPLKNPITVNDTIYVGWEQVSSEFINIGFDKSNNTARHIFFNGDGEWMNSIYEGSLMIRPAFRQKALSVTNEVSRQKPPLSVFPNPTRQGRVSIEVAGYSHQDFKIEILDLRGAMLKTFENTKNIDLTGLNPGIYILRFYCLTSHKNYTQKLVIQNP